jgi:hypothetical protein
MKRALTIERNRRSPSPKCARADTNYVEMTFAIVKGDAESEVFGAVAVARDVTDRVDRARAAGHFS